MSFQEKVINHLGFYRKEKLGIEKPGIFFYRGQKLLKEHILPKNRHRLNIMEYCRDSFYNSSSSKIKFHRYFHHLNSSQALCINLFFPLILKQKLDLILELLKIPKRQITEAFFEKESDIETGNGRKTNFDFYILLSDDTKIYFEIKYSEAGFGKAKKDNEHRDKYNKIYHPLLENNIFIKSEYDDTDMFLDSYQIMRNLCHIGDNSYVVFVYPKENQTIHLQTLFAQEKILTDRGREKFKILFLELTIDEIFKKIQSAELKEYYQELKQKYLSYE